MDVSTSSMPPSSSSWDATAARTAAAQDVPASTAPTPNGANATDETDETQADVARFASPVIGVDPSTGSTILEYRNQSNGLVTSQVPSQAALQYAEAVATTVANRSIQEIEASGSAAGAVVA